MADRERILQINALLRKHLAELIRTRYETSRQALVTISRVEATGNLQQANAYISVLPEEQSDEVVKQLQQQVRFIQKELNKQLAMRPVPRIKFLPDKQEAHAQKIRGLLDKIREEE